MNYENDYENHGTEDRPMFLPQKKIKYLENCVPSREWPEFFKFTTGPRKIKKPENSDPESPETMAKFTKAKKPEIHDHSGNDETHTKNSSISIFGSPKISRRKSPKFVPQKLQKYECDETKNTQNMLPVKLQKTKNYDINRNSEDNNNSDNNNNNFYNNSNDRIGVGTKEGLPARYLWSMEGIEESPDIFDTVGVEVKED